MGLNKDFASHCPTEFDDGIVSGDIVEVVISHFQILDNDYRFAVFLLQLSPVGDHFVPCFPGDKADDNSSCGTGFLPIKAMICIQVLFPDVS